MTKRQRLAVDVRKDQILSAALSHAKEKGFANLTRDGVAERATCATGQVNRIYTTMNQLKSAVMRAAVNELRKAKIGGYDPDTLAIVAHGLVNRHSEAIKAPEQIKKAAVIIAMG